MLPLAAGRAPVAIRLGAGKATFTVRIGRLRLGIAPVPLGVGWCDWTPPAKRATAVVTYLLGPCASGAAALGMWLLAPIVIPWLYASYRDIFVAVESPPSAGAATP